MNTTAATRPAQTPSPWSIELALVIGLPIASIIIASSLAYSAYVHGFTEMPKQEIHASARH
jgi:hypothetical protein